MQEIPLRSVPMVVTDQANVGTLEAVNFVTKSSRVANSYRNSGMYSEYSNTLRQEVSVSQQEMDTGYGFHRGGYHLGTSHGSTFGRYTHSSHARNANAQHMFEGMALPDDFLEDYYLQVLHVPQSPASYNAVYVFYKLKSDEP